MTVNMSPRDQITDQGLITLAIVGGIDGLNGIDVFGRFVVNELRARGASVLKEYKPLFISNPSTLVSTLMALGRDDDLARLNSAATIEDALEVIVAKKRVGVAYKPLLEALLQNLETVRLNVSLTKRLFDVLGPSEWPHCASMDTLESRKESPEIKLVGVTKLKDEGPLTQTLVEHLLSFCDAVVISDGNYPAASDLLTPELQSRVTLIPQAQPFDESIVYSSLFEAARNLGATHMLHMDADERMTDQLDPAGFRSLVSKLQPGESLSVPWSQMVGIDTLSEIDHSKFLPYSFRKLLPQYKDLVVCDPGPAPHHKLKFHCPWLPVGSPSTRFFADIPLLHLEGVHIPFWVQKYNATYHREFVLNNNIPNVLGRCLPHYFRNLRMIGEDSSEFLLTSEESVPSVYAEEFERRAKGKESGTEGWRTKHGNLAVAALFDQFAFKVGDSISSQKSP